MPALHNVTGSPEQVRRMFGRIASRYDLLNSLLSLGQHRGWKRRTAEACQAPPGGRVLDVCAGTADIAIALAGSGARPLALDFCRPMLALGRRKAGPLPVAFVEGDALSLPFPEGCFEAAVIGFSLRNVASVPRLLAEMSRVVRAGGWVVSLETSQPHSRVLRAVYRAYLQLAVALTPLLSDRPAYRYLLHTIVAFPPAEEVTELFRAAGLEEVSFLPLLYGAAAIHRGRVPSAVSGPA